MSIDWFFPPSSGGSDDGFNDAGIETFTGARFDGLAREIIQNSLDAAVDDETMVTVEFDFVEITRADFPRRESLLRTMKQCGQESKDKKGKAFFKNAVQELSKAKIPCLKISDSGTTGLRGDYKTRKGQWYAITKARGISEKSNETAGGSFGIGKNAPFAVSSLRTVFYSTHYTDDDGGAVYRAQGKSILKSHSMNDNEYTQATGFYGEVEGCLPIEDDIPDILRPQKPGCVVFIPGFVVEPQWQHKIMATVASNFFCAIEWGKLQVLIQDEDENIEVVEKETMDRCFAKVEALQITPEKVKNSLYYYRAMKPPTSPKESQLNRLGHCKMWVHVDEGLPKQVALLRQTGMLITDDQKGLKRWVGRADFVGVFICDSEKGNSLLRDMENPQHNAFEPERAIPDQRDECKRALDELVTWVRESVDLLAKSEETEVTDIKELNDFFPDVDPPETIPGDEGERDIEGLPVYSPKPLKRSKPKADTLDDEEGEEGGAGEEGGSGNGDGPGLGPGPGEGTGGTGTRTPLQSVELKNVRVVSDAHKSRNKTVHFTPIKSGNIEIRLAIMGDDGRVDNIRLADADGIRDGAFFVTVQRNKRISLKATLDNPVSDSIAVRAFQEKEEESGDETATK